MSALSFSLMAIGRFLPREHSKSGSRHRTGWKE
jgi:hypothetical protein